MQEEVIHKTVCILASHVPNRVKCLLDHREVDITDNLKMILHIIQDSGHVLDHPQQIPHTYRYKICIQEKKDGVIRPYIGQQFTQTKTKMLKNPFCIVNIATVSLTNVWDYDESCLYEILLIVKIKQPVDSTFQSAFTVVCITEAN